MGLLDLLQQGGSTLAYGAGPNSPSFGNDISPVDQTPILPEFTEDGSTYSEYDGNTPDINPLATKQSTLHFDFKSGTEGWSVRGYQSPSGFTTVKNYNAYADGVYNPIPAPTTLDLNDPDSADPSFKPIYTSVAGTKYEDSDFI
jgi:hypothetical protein